MRADVSSSLSRQIRTGRSFGSPVAVAAGQAEKAMPTTMSISSPDNSPGHVQDVPKVSRSNLDRFAIFGGSTRKAEPDAQPFARAKVEAAEVPTPAPSVPLKVSVEVASKSEEAAKPKTIDRFAVFQQPEEERREEQRSTQVKINMAAVKILTPLVAAISYKPGSQEEFAVKSQALSQLILKVHQAATDVTMAMGPNFASNDWARGQVMQSLAQVAAKQWEDDGQVNIQDIGRCMSQVVKEPSIEIKSALDAFNGADMYREVDSEETARARLMVSMTSAAWDIHRWVTHERLQIRDIPSFKGGETLASPSRFFSYDLPVAEVVQVILNRVVDEARSFEMEIGNTDIRLSHLQGTIRRLSDIAGAEYVTQTSSIQQWVNAAADEEEFQTRKQQAAEQFRTAVVPRIMEWARANFAAIESKGQKLLDAFKLDKDNDEQNRNTDR